MKILNILVFICSFVLISSLPYDGSSWPKDDNVKVQERSSYSVLDGYEVDSLGVDGEEESASERDGKPIPIYIDGDTVFFLNQMTKLKEERLSQSNSFKYNLTMGSMFSEDVNHNLIQKDIAGSQVPDELRETTMKEPFADYHSTQLTDKLDLKLDNENITFEDVAENPSKTKSSEVLKSVDDGNKNIKNFIVFYEISNKPNSTYSKVQTRISAAEYLTSTSPSTTPISKLNQDDFESRNKTVINIRQTDTESQKLYNAAIDSILDVIKETFDTFKLLRRDSSGAANQTDGEERDSASSVVYLIDGSNLGFKDLSKIVRSDDVIFKFNPRLETKELFVKLLVGPIRAVRRDAEDVVIDTFKMNADLNLSFTSKNPDDGGGFLHLEFYFDKPRKDDFQNSEFFDEMKELFFPLDNLYLIIFKQTLLDPTLNSLFYQ